MKAFLNLHAARGRLFACTLSAGALAAAIAPAPAATPIGVHGDGDAVVYTFEAPGYSIGDINGQQGWTTDFDGYWAISDAHPYAGAQHMRLTSDAATSARPRSVPVSMGVGTQAFSIATVAIALHQSGSGSDTEFSPLSAAANDYDPSGPLAVTRVFFHPDGSIQALQPGQFVATTGTITDEAYHQIKVIADNSGNAAIEICLDGVSIFTGINIAATTAPPRSSIPSACCRRRRTDRRAVPPTSTTSTSSMQAPAAAPMHRRGISTASSRPRCRPAGRVRSAAAARRGRPRPTAPTPRRMPRMRASRPRRPNPTSSALPQRSTRPAASSASAITGTSSRVWTAAFWKSRSTALTSSISSMPAGSFVEAGYNGSLSDPAQSARCASGVDRPATGLSSPPRSICPTPPAGQPVAFRWRLGSNAAGVADGSNGWWIDTVALAARVLPTQPVALISPGSIDVVLDQGRDHDGAVVDRHCRRRHADVRHPRLRHGARVRSAARGGRIGNPGRPRLLARPAGRRGLRGRDVVLGGRRRHRHFPDERQHTGRGKALSCGAPGTSTDANSWWRRSTSTNTAASARAQTSTR